MSTSTLEQALDDVTDATPSTKPVAKFSFRGISASVFENTTKEGKTFHKVTLQRSFKVGEEFKANASFTRDELPIAIRMLERAHDWILDAESNS
jgi:hypothetical protein